jgi:hypothetical protein
MTSSPPEVSVVIVNFHSTDALRDCLDALARSTIAARLQVIVVDNATPGFEPGSIQREDLDLTVLPQACNTTFTGGNNIGALMARGRFLLMLNPDTRVEPEALERAVMHLDADRAVVALGAWFVDEQGSFRPYYRRLPRLRDVPVVLIPRLLDWTPMARRYRMADETFADSTVVEQPAGAFLLARRSACPEPLLDDGYFNFFSDVELCRRLWEHGVIRVEPDVRCYHARGGAGLITYEPDARARLHQDLVWGVRRYFQRSGTLGRAWIGIWVVAFWAMRLLQAITTDRRYPRATWAALIASLRGQPPHYEGWPGASA